MLFCFVCLFDLYGWGNFSHQLVLEKVLILLLVFIITKMQGLGIGKFDMELFDDRMNFNLACGIVM